MADPTPQTPPAEVLAWLEKASPEALEALQGQVGQRLETIEDDLDQAAKAEIAAVLERRGKSMEQLYGWRKLPAAKRKAAKKPAAAAKPSGPLYKDPLTGDTARTPRGNPKAWLKAHLDAGFKIEEFEVQPNGEIGRPDAKTWRVDGDRLTSDS